MVTIELTRIIGKGTIDLGPILSEIRSIEKSSHKRLIVLVEENKYLESQLRNSLENYELKQMELDEYKKFIKDILRRSKKIEHKWNKRKYYYPKGIKRTY